MVLDSFDFLIVLVPFACYEDDVALLGQHDGRLDGLAAVGNAHYFLHLLLVQPGQHVVDDVLWFLEAGVVAGDDDAVALPDGLLGHERSLALVAVATGSADGDDFWGVGCWVLGVGGKYFVDGVQHVLQRVRCVGIVDDGCHALSRADGFQSSGYALQRAQHDEDVFGLLAQHDGSSVDGQQVGDVELANELHAHLAAVNLQIHALEVALDDFGTKVGHLAYGVGLDPSFRVLHHEEPVLVVGIGDGEGVLG